MWRRVVIGRLLPLAISLAFGLLLAEGVVRWSRPQAVLITEPGLYVQEGDGYGLAPGYRGSMTNRVEFEHSISINAHGLRGPEIAPRGEVPRILVVGDSFAFGVGVEDSGAFPLLTGARLEGRAELLNGGVSGFGVPDEVAWVERHGASLAPDWVVLAVFLGNDLQEASGEVHVVVVDGLIAAPGTKRGLREWLYHHSHLVALLKTAVPTGLQSRLRSALGRGEPWSLRSLRRSTDIYSVEPPDFVREGVARTEAALDRLLELGHEQGFRVAAFLIPDHAQVDEARWQAVVTQLGLDPEGYDLRAPNRLFRGLFEARGVPVLDPTERYAELVGAGEQPYWRYDRHWRPLGHETAARLLAEFLALEVLTKPDPGPSEAPS